MITAEHRGMFGYGGGGTESAAEARESRLDDEEAMGEEHKQERLSRTEWFKRYVVGLGAGTVAALYGIVAMLMGRTFLPGLTGTSHTVKNRSGLALAVGYLLGGLYLLLRLYLEKRMDPATRRSRLYWTENVLLAGLTAALIYVLLNVGAVQ